MTNHMIGPAGPSHLQLNNDCNSNGIPDDCDLVNGPPDVNSNNIPDSCEFLISSYCSSSPNSAGSGVQIVFNGTPSVSVNEMGFSAQGEPNHQPGLFFYGPGSANQPFGEGIRCVSATGSSPRASSV